MKERNRIKNAEQVNARLAYLKDVSPNKEVGVLVVKELPNGLPTNRRYELKPTSIIKNKKVHRRFVDNLMTVISHKTTLEIDETKE